MSYRIMIVDDDSALRSTLHDLMYDEGLDVIAAENGIQAIKFASEGQIDLIFMDILMPGINGVETFMQIKEILPNCIVFMMTGYAVESLVRTALSEGAKACLSKPVSSLRETVIIVAPAQQESTNHRGMSPRPDRPAGGHPGTWCCAPTALTWGQTCSRQKMTVCSAATAWAAYPCERGWRGCRRNGTAPWIALA